MPKTSKNQKAVVIRISLAARKRLKVGAANAGLSLIAYVDNLTK